MKKDFYNTIRFDNWQDLLTALEYSYTISFKDVCEILKASRTWVNRYIRPNVKTLYISNNKRGDGIAGANWVKLAAMALNREDMTESIWFHRQDFYDFICSSIVSVTKQTKKVPYTYLMEPAAITAFVDHRRALREEIKHADNPIWQLALYRTYNNLYREYLSEDAKQLLPFVASPTARTKAPAIDTQLPENFMEKWFAIHDIKNYGDAEETLYRDLFKNGAIRIELQVPDENGYIGRKVFYMDDPNPVTAPYAEEGSLCIQEEAWNGYTKKEPTQITSNRLL